MQREVLDYFTKPPGAPRADSGVARKLAGV
jgi:hypothetical protein